MSVDRIFGVVVCGVVYMRSSVETVIKSISDKQKTVFTLVFNNIVLLIVCSNQRNQPSQNTKSRRITTSIGQALRS